MTLELILLLVAVFISVALVAAAIASGVLSWAAPDRKRLREMMDRRSTGLVIDESALALSRVPSAAYTQLSRILPKGEKERNSLQRQMARAGFRQPIAAPIYKISELGLAAAGAGLPLAVLGLESWPLAAFCGFLGFLAPGFYIAKRMAKRRLDIRNGLPDALDLFVLCLEAGSSLDQAIVRASEELALAYPALADELRILTTEVRAGKPRLEAFRNLADRTRVDDVRSLVAMLVQTDRFGTSIAQALRTHADVGRTKRRQRAEERAGKVGVKLVFPLVLCLFPALYVVILGPAIIQIVRVFGN